ncbi:614/534 cytochrome P450 [Vararia minispora EC-137]|uniref:614/534 cytochrome P450 n=1 Tax=Vararia minispora EC-137 TaxID=1314806 RepID=A0ACB8QFY9_9AGAM|nr:614/534 cytochrome P450 [Vararia minispora EC-137]
MHIGVVLGLSFAALHVVQRVLEYRRAVASVGDFPGARVLLSPASVISGLLSRFLYSCCPALAAGFDPFEKVGWDASTTVSFYPTTSIIVEVADPAAIKEIVTHRARFPKPLEWYGVLKLFGTNVVTTEGNEWKKHRKVAAPAFTEKNYRMVWDETARIMQDLLDNEWKRAPEIQVNNAIDLAVPITLYIIASAGFGHRISWAEEKNIPTGHTMTFKESIHIVSTKVFYKLITPRWILGYTESLRRLRDAFDDFDKYMFEMIEARRSKEMKEERADLFTNLLQATEAESDAKLTDRELAGNIFIFLLAGHETTAHTLCFCLAYLALYPHVQDRLYEEIKSVLSGSDSLPAYEDMGRLPYMMACFYETLRLVPPVLSIPKVSGEDQSLAISNIAGEKRLMPLPKGTHISINTAALHRNPRFWSEPNEFKPERFLGDWPRDAFIPFSHGARSCIGRRFAETEAIVILSMLLAHYRVSVTDEPRFAHETFEQRKERVLSNKPGITTTPVRVPLTFTRY